MALTDAKIQELKQQHGNDLIAVQSSAGEVLVFRKPKRLEYDQWYDGREKGSSQAGLNLARQCIIYPDAAAMMNALESSPGMLMCKDGIVDSITDLAGADGGVSQKKL